MTVPTLGINFIRNDFEPTSQLPADFSKVGICADAETANATTFPLNVPVRFFSNDTVKLAALGATSSPIKDALEQLNAQLAEFQAAADVVVIRVAKGIDNDATMTNIIGNEASKTGIWGFVDAGPLTGAVPRIILTPSYTGAQKVAVTGGTITAPGSAGSNGTFPLVFTGGVGVAAVGTFTVTAGAVTNVTVTTQGAYTTVPTGVDLSGSAGLTGAAVTLATDALANPVAAALPAVLNKILAHAVVSSPDASLLTWTNWREPLASDRLIGIQSSVKVGASATVKTAEGIVAGAMIAEDFRRGGIPSGTGANRPVYGIVGTARPLAFSWLDGASEAQQILAQNGCVILRGESAVETAVSDAGFIFMGTDNLGTSANKRTYVSTRMADYITVMSILLLRKYPAAVNITSQSVTAIHNELEALMRGLQAGGHILGYNITFPQSDNPAADLRAGQVDFTNAYETSPVLKRVTITVTPFAKALEDLSETLAAALN